MQKSTGVAFFYINMSFFLETVVTKALTLILKKEPSFG